MTPFLQFLLSAFLAAWGRVFMQWSFSIVFDLAKVVSIIILLAIGLYVVEQKAKESPILFPRRIEPEAKKEKKLLRPLLPRGEMDEEPLTDISLGDTHPPDGSAIQIDYPLSQDKRNIRSRVDGAGMCVTTAGEMSAIWSGLEELRGFRDFAARENGGCDPPKFDDQLARFCKLKGIEVPRYLQYQGKDPEFLRLVLKTGRMPAVTYSGADGVQYAGRIAHVNNLVHFSNGIAGVYDNNYSPAKRIWMSEAEYLERAKFGRSKNYWAIVWLPPGPPPAVSKK